MKRKRRFWTRAQAIAALQFEAKCQGRTPSEAHMRARDRVCASLRTYIRLFGSVANAQRAAGLVPNRHGGPKGWRKKVCHRGHPRTPRNVDSQGHCCLCDAKWKARRGRGPLMPRIVIERRKLELQSYWRMAS